MAFIKFQSTASRRIFRKIAKEAPRFGGWLFYQGFRLFRVVTRGYLLILILVALAYFGRDWFGLIGDLREVVEGAAGALSGGNFADPNVRNIAYILGGSAAALIALATAPFALIKAWVNERQATTSEQGHITERMTRAIEQLGAEKTVKKGDEERTEPNLEVRLGAIYALERIAQDSERDHIPIMETLCAYVRENSKERTPREFPLPEWQGVAEDADEETKKAHADLRNARLRGGNARDWVGSIAAPRADIQAVMTIIGRRPLLRRVFERSRGYSLDLRAANLQRADLSELRLERVLFVGARLEGANLGGAKMEGANLSWAKMEGANLSWAKMEGAYLSRARMEGANLGGARMEGANLGGASLKSADLARCTFARTRARSADFTGVKNMSQEQVNALFGDTDTKLPDGVTRTTELNHAPLENSWDADPEFERWKAAGYPAGVPLDDP